MSKLFDDLAAIDRKIADRWKIGTRDNNKHVLVRGRCHRTSFRAIDFADSLLYNNDLGYMNGSGSRLSLSAANLWVPMSITRRAFLRFTAGAARLAAGLGGAMVGYAAGFEPNDLVLERKTVKSPKLPNAFDGFRIVLLTDLHLHPFTSANLIRRTVEISNSVKPDLVLLCGDYVCGFAEAAFELGSILESLDAEHGFFGVLGKAQSAPSSRHRLSLSVLPAVTITRAPRWRATCNTADPTLPEPPLMNSVSPALRPASRINPGRRSAPNAPPPPPPAR